LKSAILASAAGGETAVGVHQREGFDVTNDRLEREPAAVNVCTERAAERQAVSAGLLLNDAPGLRLPPLHSGEALDQFGPLDARLGFDHTILGIEMDDAPHRSHIEKRGIAGELLTAHRVPSACNADRLAFRRGQGRAQRRFRIDGYDAVDARGIELRMDIVDEDARLGARRSERPRRRRATKQRDELASPHSITSSARESSE
jgi:hypothetical protein